MLENFADDAPPVSPIPGQLWYNNVSKVLNVNTGTTDGDTNAWTQVISSDVPVQPESDALTGLSNIGDSSNPAVPNSLIMSTGPDTFVYLPITPLAQTLLDDASASAMRTTLGLGTASTATIQTSQLDTTAGRVMTTGAFGLGVIANQPNWPSTSLDNCSGAGAGSYRTISTTTQTPVIGTVVFGTNCLVEFRIRSTATGDVEYFQQVTDVVNLQMAFRTSTGAGSASAPAWGTWINMIGGSGGGGVYQPLSNVLTGLSGLTITANSIIYGTGANAFQIGTAGTTGKAVMAAADQATARSALGLGTAATYPAATTATANTVVLRDSSGQATVTATSAATLTPGRNINGVLFDGSANITVVDSTKLPINGVSPMTGQLTVNYNAGATPAYSAGQVNLTSGGANPVVLGFSRTGSGSTTGAMLAHNGSGVAVYGTVFGTVAPLACGTLTVTGTITASGDVIAFSDARLKTNLTVIDNAVAKINKLQGVTYDRIDTGKRQTGLIAQEVQAILPEAVHEAEDEDKTLGLAYGNLAGLFVEAIKEMSATIARLEAEVAALKNNR